MKNEIYTKEEQQAILNDLVKGMGYENWEEYAKVNLDWADEEWDY